MTTINGSDRCGIGVPPEIDEASPGAGDAIPGSFHAPPSTESVMDTISQIGDFMVAATSSPAVPDRDLSQGATGSAVAGLQSLLTMLGFFEGTNRVDGIYGPRTAEAVRAFQRAAGLEPDGICGPKTRAALHAALGDGLMNPHELQQLHRPGPAPVDPEVQRRQLEAARKLIALDAEP